MNSPAKRRRHRPRSQPHQAGDAGGERALLGTHHRHDVGLPGRHVHLDQPLAQEEQHRRDRESSARRPRWRAGGSRDVGEHHGVHEPDALRPATRAARCENAFITRAPKNSAPITASLAPKRSKKKNESSARGEEPAAQAVEREQRADPPQHPAALGRDHHLGTRAVDLDRRRQRRVEATWSRSSSAA